MSKGWTDERLDGFEERVDRRFDEIDRRFEDVDRRFEDVDRRFEDVDRRFEDVDRRFVEMAGLLSDMRRTGKRQFAQIDERLGRVEALATSFVRAVLALAVAVGGGFIAMATVLANSS